MTERYADAVRALREVPVPDQWDDIVARLAEPSGAEVPGQPGLGDPGPGGSHRRWPLVLAVAATVAVIVGTIALAGRPGTDLSTTEQAPASGGSDTTTAPGPTTTTTATSSTSPSTTTAPPSGALPNEVVDLDSYPVSACRGLRFTASDPPAGLDGVMQAVASDDPRVPSAVHGLLTGVFPAAARSPAVFVVAGWPGLQDDAGRHVEGPFPGVQSWTAPYDQGWLAEIAAPASADTYCPFTLIGLGLGEAELHQFLAGLALEASPGGG